VTTERTGAPPPLSDVPISDVPISELSPPSSEGVTSETGLLRRTLPAIAPETQGPRPAVMHLRSGRSISVTEVGGEEQLEVRAAGGTVLLSMRLTDEGPVVSLSGASLSISAAKTLSLSAETLRLSASADISIEAGGALVQKSAGPALREIGGLDRTTAAEVEVDVHPGGISLRANDDVDIVGERVRLNSEDPPMPQTWEEHRARHALPVEATSAEPSPDRTVRDEEPAEER
jgi:hypothetical protein